MLSNHDVPDRDVTDHDVPDHDVAAIRLTLSEYLQAQREGLLSKLDGLPERDQRRPMTPTGTNLLGLVKHCSLIEFGYLGECFGRPSGVDLSAIGPETEINADLFAAAHERPEQIVAQYRAAWAHSDATLAALDLETVGEVPWWPAERRRPTLHRVLVHVIAETARHAGHADIVRESIDGAVGLRPSNPNLPSVDAAWWADYRARLQAIADAAG